MARDWVLVEFESTAEEWARRLGVSAEVGRQILQWAETLKDDPTPDYAVSHWQLDSEELGSYFFSKVPGTEHGLAEWGNHAVGCGWRVHAGRGEVRCEVIDVYPDIGLNMQPDYHPPPEDD